MARRRAEAQAQRLILDSGAVIALSRGDERARSYLARALEIDADIQIPVVVLAETLRGGAKDAAVNRVLEAVGHSHATTPEVGRRAGALLGAATRTDVIDAMVVAEAVERGGGRILTADPNDLRALATRHPDVIVDDLRDQDSRHRR